MPRNGSVASGGNGLSCSVTISHEWRNMLVDILFSGLSALFIEDVEDDGGAICMRAGSGTGRRPVQAAAR